MKNQNLFFRPTNKFFKSMKDYEEEKHNFFYGDINEEFMLYCAKQCIHGFWVNYKNKDHKISKEKFSEKFRELINEMLKEI